MFMWLHIVGGAAGLSSGLVAGLAAKGSRLHARAGQVFATSMSLMALSGAWLALRDQDLQSIVAGLFTFQLVGTAWLAVRPDRAWTRRAGYAFVAWGLVLAAYVALAFMPGIVAAEAGTGTRGFLALVGLGALATALADLRSLLGPGLPGRARWVRHLWRMLLALVLASAAFFLGQADEFPAAWRGPHLALPALAALLAIPYWLWRIRRPGWRVAVRRGGAASVPPPSSAPKAS